MSRLFLWDKRLNADCLCFVSLFYIILLEGRDRFYILLGWMALNFNSSMGKRSNTITNLLKSDLALNTMIVAVVKSHTSHFRGRNYNHLFWGEWWSVSNALILLLSQIAYWYRLNEVRNLLTYMMSLSHLSSVTFVLILPLNVSWVSVHCQTKELQ
jgi:hypothetical protein